MVLLGGGCPWDAMHLIIIISVLEAQVLDLNCCSPVPSCSSAFSTASYETPAIWGQETLSKSQQEPHSKNIHLGGLLVISSELVWLVLEIAVREKLAGWERQHIGGFLASVPPERNDHRSEQLSLCCEPI